MSSTGSHFRLAVASRVRIESGDGGAQLREALLRREVAAERLVLQETAHVPVPELHVVLDDLRRERVRILVDLHDEAMRREIRVHPLDHVALLHVERMAQALVVEHHLREDAVDLHHAERARDLHAAVLDLEVGVGVALAALYFLDVDLEGFGGVLLRGDPDFVAVEVALHAHVGVVGERVLCDEIHVRTEVCRVDHVRGHESARIGAAEEDRMRLHLLRPERVGKGFLVLQQLVADLFRAVELPRAKLPAEGVTILLGGTQFKNETVVRVVLVDRDE